VTKQKNVCRIKNNIKWKLEDWNSLGTECERREKKTYQNMHQRIPPGNTKGHPILKRANSTSNEYTAEDWNQNMFEDERSKIW